MKAFVFVLLCALAAVQGRYHELPSTRSPAALGENPWVVHLRIAVSTSGLLETCVGSLIDNRWVLTSASCISDARFIWIRYGVVNVINPSLVTENSLVRLHPDDALGVVNINRDVETGGNINTIGIGSPSDTGKVCGFGQNADGAPGELLSCSEVTIVEEDEGLVVVGFEASVYDIGAALVSNGAQVGVLVDESGSFLATADYLDWLEEVTGVSFSPEAESLVQ